MTTRIIIPGSVNLGVGYLLNFSAVDSAHHEGHVSVAAAVKLDNGTVHTYTMVMPVERAQGYAEKLQLAINRALMNAPRRAGKADV